MHYDYESLGRVGEQRRPELLEAYRGVDIVSWQGRIERQLERYVAETTDARNYAYAAKLREYLKIWREHVLTGSINVETITALTTPSEVLAVDDWKYADYFSNLRDQLRRLKASVEELPNVEEVPPAERAPGPGAPPSSFGPSDEPPLADGSPAPVEGDATATLDAAAAETGEAPPDELEPNPNERG